MHCTWCGKEIQWDEQRMMIDGLFYHLDPTHACYFEYIRHQLGRREIPEPYHDEPDPFPESPSIGEDE